LLHLLLINYHWNMFSRFNTKLETRLVINNNAKSYKCFEFTLIKKIFVVVCIMSLKKSKVVFVALAFWKLIVNVWKMTCFYCEHVSPFYLTCDKYLYIFWMIYFFVADFTPFGIILCSIELFLICVTWLIHIWICGWWFSGFFCLFVVILHGNLKMCKRFVIVILLCSWLLIIVN